MPDNDSGERMETTADKPDKKAASAPVRQPRYSLPWRIVVIHKKMGAHEKFRGGITDISMSGVLFYSDNHISPTAPVVVAIEIPPYVNQRSMIIGARCVVHFSTFSSASYGKYRVVLRFLDFDRGGRKDLKKALDRREELNKRSGLYDNFKA